MGNKMKVKLNGHPEDIIQRCDACEYCIFDDILTDEQRKIKVLDLDLPENHMQRSTIEQLCGRRYDDVCPMKYVAMRAFCYDSNAMRM